MTQHFFRFFILLFLISSCEEIVNEENISNDTVQLLAPSNDAVLATKQKITFNWEALGGTSSYKLQIATPNFISATQIQLDTLVSRTDFTIDSLVAKSYEWRVKGLNSAYETVYSVNAFVVKEP